MKHPGISPLSGQRTCLPLVASCLAAATIFCWATVATAGENLLANSSFSEGAPQGDSFGWTFDLAADQQSACSVVEVSENSRKTRFRKVRPPNGHSRKPLFANL